MTGILIDIALIAVAVGIAILFYRRRSRQPAAGVPQPRGQDGPSGGWLRSRWTTLVRQAGLDPSATIPVYALAKLTLTVTSPLLVLELSPPDSPTPAWPWLALAALAGFAMPDGWLLAIRRARRRAIADGLLQFLDLFVSLLAAGLNLAEAFRRAGRTGLEPSHPLAGEVALVAAEIDSGRDPGSAFGALAERTGVRDLQGIAGALELCLRVGAPIRPTLQAQAEQLWMRRREGAFKLVHTASVKAMFPVFLCGFPIFGVLVFFPAILQMVEAFRELFGVYF